MGVAASAKEVQEVVKAVNDVIDLLKKLDRERSAVLEVQNLTTSTLRRVSDNHDDGGFAESPSLEILPGQVDVFGSQSSGILSGAKGQVTYESRDGFLFTIEWENPFVGTPSCSARLVGDNTENFQAKHICGVGKRAHMQYIVEPGITAEPIVRKDSADAGRVSEIVAVKSQDQELVTAVRTAGETLKLIPWRVRDDGAIARLADGAEAGEASHIDLGSSPKKLYHLRLCLL